MSLVELAIVFFAVCGVIAAACKNYQLGWLLLCISGVIALSLAIMLFTSKRLVDAMPE